MGATGSSSDAAPAISWTAAVVAAVCPSVLASTPLFLAGTLALRIRDDLGFGVTRLGVVLALFAGTGALLGPLNGRIAERLGAGRGLAFGTLGVGAATLAVAVGARQWWTLALLMSLAGGLASLVQTSSNLWIARTVRPTRQGLALGLKQSAPPMAALLAGVAVPAIAVTVGWRWAFAASGVLAALAASTVPHRFVPGEPRRSRHGTLDLSLTTLVALSSCLTLGNAAASAFTGFLVTSAVDHGGLSESAAGVVFAVGSLVGIASRVALGHLADRSQRSAFALAAGLLATGSAGTALFATGHPLVFVCLTPVVFATAWGWVGLFVLGVIRSNERSPATASGIIQVGGGLGYMVGPIGFGVLASRSEVAAWLAVAATGAAAAGAILLTRRRVARELVGGSGLAP